MLERIRRWFRSEIQIILRWDGLLLVLAYAICYLFARNLSVDQWYLPAGLRVAALVLLPPRYWPYLIAGEVSAFAYLRYPLLDKYGLTWAIVASTTLMPAAAYIVHWHRKLIAGYSTQWMVSVAILAAAVVSIINVAATMYLMTPVQEQMTFEKALTYAVGQYLAILTILPLVVLWKLRKLSYPFPRKLRWDAIVGLVVIVGLCLGAKYVPELSALQRTALRIFMLAPVAVMTVLHGWRGAAIGIVGVNLALRMTLYSSGFKGSHDEETFIVQEVLVIAGTALLWAGAVISHYYQKARHYGFAEKQALQIARAGFASSEREMRERAEQMRGIGKQSEMIFQGMAQALQKSGQPEAAMEVLRSGVEQTRQIKHQLDLIYPPEIEQYGLYGALDTDALSTAWAHHTRIVRQLRGDPHDLSLNLQLAAYRCIYEGVAALSDAEHCRILIRVRCGNGMKRHYAAIRIASMEGPLKLSVETNSKQLEALEARVRAYGGILHRRSAYLAILIDELIEPASTYGAALSTDQVTPSVPL